MKVRFLFLAFLLSACTTKIERPGPEISFKGDRLLFRGQEFTGVVIEKFDAVGTIRETHYRQGQPDGVQDEYFASSGQKVARRQFLRGRNVGVHEGWYLDGRRRFHYEYDDEGRSHGEFWEWYNSGPPSLFAKFALGQLLGKKMWREDGKIYLNNVFTATRAFGLPGTKLCFQVRAN